MDRDLPDSSREKSPEEPTETSNGYPSTQAIVLLYTLGAVVGLVLAFNPSLSALQSTNCLVLSWVLAVAALGMSILGDASETTASKHEDY